MLHPSLRFLLVFFLALCTVACVPKQQGTSDTGGSQTAWQLFAARANAEETGSSAFRASANLRYTTKEGDSARVSALLWGNGNVTSPYPLRLDLTAGVGTTVARIREDKTLFTAYSPDEKALYVHPRGQQTLVSFGVPIPLALSDLTLILTGRCGRLFLPQNTTAASPVPAGQSASADGTFFPIHGAPLSGILELDANGTPLSWREHGGNGWIIAFEPDATNPMQPRRLRITHPEGYSATIAVKDVSYLPAPFTAAQMDLNVPAGTAQKSLETASR